MESTQHPLDDDHVLEPVTPSSESWRRRLRPMVTDIHGRQWRLRRTRRLSPDELTAVVAALCVALVLCIWLIVGNI